MSDAAIHAFGTVTKLGSTSDPNTATYATIPECKNAPIPGKQHPRINTSTHDNSSFNEEYVANLGTLPEIVFGDMNWLPNNAVHQDLQELNDSGEIRLYKVFLNGSVSPAVTIRYPAYVSNFQPGAPVDNVYGLACSLQPTAAPTYGSS